MLVSEGFLSVIKTILTLMVTMVTTGHTRVS